jgi:hypothetical protein
MALLMADRIERPSLSLFGERGEIGDDVGGGPTLDDCIVGAWEGLTAQVAVACPLCDGQLRPRPGGDAGLGGCCDRCGTTLA